MNTTAGELQRLLQESLNLLRQPNPIVLTADQAAERAMLLRQNGLTYAAIAKVMGIYHGLWYTESKWRRLCRQAGCPPVTYLDGSPRVPPWTRRNAS